MSTAADVAARTAGRDRFVDALRVLSLVVVILGHWLMADVRPDGEVGNALVSVPALTVATWVLQVMPLFFLVGGVAHGFALESLESRLGAAPGRYAVFVRSRAGRLLRPTLVLVAVWVAVGLLLRALGLAGSDLVLTALRLVTQPLWFVGIYLGVAALAPAMLAAHRRWGLLVVAGLVAGACTVDLLRFGFGLTVVGTLNFALVWLAVHQLGFCLASGALTRGRAVLMTAGGLAALVLLVTAGPYPVSMVGLPGESVSNMAPPTVALLAQAVAMVGAAVLLRDAVGRLLGRPRVWAGVVLLGSAAMTAFLWHLSALFLAVLGMWALGWTPSPVGTAVWWAIRPVWLAVLAALTVVLVALFRRFEAVPRPEVGERSRWVDVVAALGAALCAVGVLMVSVTGVDVLGGDPVRFVVLDVVPAAAGGVLLAGLGLMALAGRQSTSTGWPAVMRSSSS
ncbi:MAG: acyltransferase family protein [Actinomycetes bacterium]